MNPTSRDRLYKLLPAIYKLRDAAEGDPLRALLAVIEQEVAAIEDDIGNLYDNWFIETCDEWVIPYVGDLLDVRALYASSFPTTQPPNSQPIAQALLADRPAHPRPYGQQERRAYIANTLAYRRRKGTTPVLEQLVRDVTGWRARAIEFSRLLLTTQNLNHPRTESATVDLRADSIQQRLNSSQSLGNAGVQPDSSSLDLVGTPFEQQAAYTAELRRASRGGKYNIPNIGLFIWRLQSYPIQRGTACAVAGLDPEPTGRFYTFNPLGDEDVPLFNQPQAATDLTKQAQEINLPVLLRYAPLAQEVKERRRLRLQGKSLPSPRYFNDSSPVLQIFVDGQPNPIPPEEILICRLTLTDAELAVGPVETQAKVQEHTSAEEYPWRLPNADAEQSQDDVPIPTKVVAVDPELGRIAFLDRTLPERVEVSYLYGFSDDMGGGSYSRGVARIDLLKSLLKHAAQPPSASQNEFQNLQQTAWMHPLFWEVEQLTSADENPLDTAIQDWNRTVLAWQGLRDQTHIPLAQITIPPVQVSRMSSSNIPPQFKPGIVGQGLTVLPGCCPTEIVIMPGLALDRQGRRLPVQRIEILDLSQFDLSASPQSIGQWILIICYRAALEGPHYQFALVPETAIGDDGYPEGTSIPLARLQLDSEQQLVGPPDVSVRDLLQFHKGIVQGCKVEVGPGTLEVMVTPGTAVDGRANVLVNATTQKLDLVPYQGMVGSLIASSTNGKFWELKFIPGIVADQESSICLANLDVPRIEADQIRIAPSPRTVVRDSSTGAAIGAVIVDGLAVTVTGTILTVTAGTAKDSQGRDIKLEQAYQFDLSSYAAQQFVLFICQQTGQGFPLQPLHSSVRQDWQQLGIVPQEPDPADTGIILIKDSLKYEGDLDIAIPQGKKLKIVAVDGCRPHIAGNVLVQGTAPAEAPNQGVLVLDGLLIEGQLKVLPGNLQRLHLIHSTLVPEQGGLWVQPAEPPAACAFDADDPFAPLAFVTAILALVQETWTANLRLDRSPEKHLGQLTQIVMQQINRLLAEIWQLLCPWITPGTSSLDSAGDDWNCLFRTFLKAQNTDSQSNSSLEISLYHSICGPLTLTATIPKLEIEDSILDKGQSRNNEPATSGLAIWAPTTDTTISNTTVLGMTTVRSLEASNSLFTEKVTVQLHQTGCIRFSYVPEGSQTPPRYQCQPDKALQEVLDPIPVAITSIAIHELEPDLVGPMSHPAAYLFSSSAGGGIFRSINHGERWERANNQPSNPYVATLLAYDQPGVGKVQVENSDKPTVRAANPKATVFTQQLRPGDRLTIAHQTRTVTEILNDEYLTVDQRFDNLTETDSFDFQITTVLAGATGGQIFRSRNNGGSRSNESRNNEDGWVALNLPGVTSTITALLPYNWSWEGTLKDQQQIEIHGDVAQVKCQAGDTITIANAPGTAEKPIRQISEVRAGQPTPEATPTTLLRLNAPIDHASAKVSFSINTVLATTAGDGIWRGNANGENWIPLNSGLTNSDVRALAVDQTGQIFAGTAGDGVFQLTHQPSHTEQKNGWRSINEGLKNHNITALAVDPDGIIFVGTAGGGIFYFNPDEERWIEANQGLTSLDISALAATVNSLVTATKDGKIYHSQDQGQHWGQPSLDLQGLDVTVVAATPGQEPNHPTLFAGTAAGNILRFDSANGRWLSVNAGLTNVVEKLLLLEQLQPVFTSTRYGDPGYGQLSQNYAYQLRTGAEDGAEMGTFNGLKQPQREANLQANLEEYLRFGLEAGIFYVT